MNDKDKEAFDKWFKDFCSVRHTKHDCFSGWQAACEYKNKEYSDIADARMQTSLNNVKLQAENAKLRECVEWYVSEYHHDLKEPEFGGRARKVLKELDEE